MRVCGAALLVPLLGLWLALVAPAQAGCEAGEGWAQRGCRQLSDTWELGQNDLYLPFRAIHLNDANSAERIHNYREATLGLGYGRSRYDAAGNWHGLYGVMFLDSNSRLQPITGYGYQWMWGPRQGLHAGLGYSVFVTARADIRSYLPFPAILPMASINYGRASVNAAFLPGGTGFDSILFLWGRVGF